MLTLPLELIQVESYTPTESKTENTYYRWRKEYGGLDVAQAKRLKELEKENSRLKKLVAEQALDIEIMKEMNRGD